MIEESINHRFAGFSVDHRSPAHRNEFLKRFEDSGAVSAKMAGRVFDGRVKRLRLI
jgi:hypothetical protein